MAPGSGLPRDRAFPHVGVGEIGYEDQVAEYTAGLRSLRRATLGIVLVAGVLAIVLAMTGRPNTAYGLLLMIIIPLGLILVIAEIVNLARRQRSS